MTLAEPNDEHPSQRAGWVFLINASASEMLAQGIELCYQQFGRLFDVRVFYVHEIDDGRMSPDVVRQCLQEADLVFLDIRGGGRALGLATSALGESHQPVVVLVGGSPDVMGLLRLGSFSLQAIMQRTAARPSSGESRINVRHAQTLLKLVETGGDLFPLGQLRDARNWARAMRYWQHGGAENVKNLLQFIGRSYAGLPLPTPAAPRTHPDFGLYDLEGQRFFRNVNAYRRAVGYDAERPTIGLLMYGGLHFHQSTIPALAMARVLHERYHCNVLPVFAGTGYNLKAIRQLFLKNGQAHIDALVYFQWFQLTTFSGDAPDAGVKLLHALGVPVFDAAPLYGREVAKWQADIQGFSPVETLTAVILPELDGMIEPLPTAGLVEHASETIGTVKQVTPIPDRIDRMAARVHAWTRLRRLENAAKRVAVILYDNPPGEDNLGNAAYLDVCASLDVLLHSLSRQGYAIEGAPEPGAFPEYLLSHGLVNNPKWSGSAGAGVRVSVAQYQEWLAALPVGTEISDVWGEPPGDIMVSQGSLRLPVVEFGNVLVGVQPARGYHSDPDKISHDKTLPPHHQYVAFYRWLEEVWKPDAIIHVGTHGTLEFLQGKELGMSAHCWPEILIGNTPHLYLYHVVNASEATIAKRRSLGTLVSYNSPAFTTAGLYDAYADLEARIAEYTEAQTLDPSRAERLAQAIADCAVELNLAGASVAVIHEELTRMKRSLIPRGLHVIGDYVTDEQRIDFATLLLRNDRDGAPSVFRLLLEQRGYAYDTVLAQPLQVDASGNLIDVLALVEVDVRAMIVTGLMQGKYPDDPTLRRSIQDACAHALHLDADGELRQLLAGLDGRYIPPGLGGDPIRTPEVLPTGRNSYQFDPRLVPTTDAMQRGRAIAENTLQAYVAAHQTYPRSTAVILWGFETTKTRGETVGQILAYLGVEIDDSGSPYAKRLKLIPLETLGRPRIDCHVQICGFFRDMYPNVVELLHRAFVLASNAEETDEVNAIRQHTREIAGGLRATHGAETAHALAAGRIFGPPPGEYGTRTTHLIETAQWQSEEDIVRLYARTMSHLYTDRLHGAPCPEVYQERLARIDVVSQVRDCHEYEIADLDHYYEFFGGLSRSVESVKGVVPMMLISDTTREVIRTEAVGDALNRGLRTRLLNPQWIDGMLQHDYHGAQQISDRVENLIGFAATTHAVDNWVWSAVTTRYLEDQTMFERLSANNRFASEEILKRLFEAERRGYWQASEEEMAILRQRYLQLEGMIEGKMPV